MILKFLVIQLYWLYYIKCKITRATLAVLHTVYYCLRKISINRIIFRSYLIESITLIRENITQIQLWSRSLTQTVNPINPQEIPHCYTSLRLHCRSTRNPTVSSPSPKNNNAEFVTVLLNDYSLPRDWEVILTIVISSIFKKLPQ